SGNTYTKDADKTNGSGTSGVRTLVFSAPITTSLANGTITVATSPATNVNIAATFFSFNGLVSTSAADQLKTGTGSSTLPNSGNTLATSQPDELLIGALGIEDKNPAVTQGAGFTKLTQSSVTGGQATHNVYMQPEYEVVHSTGAYSAGGTLGTSAKWAAAIVTYKIKTPSVSSIVRNDPDPTNGPTVHFTVTFSDRVVGVDASDFTLTTTGTASGAIGSVVDNDDNTFTVSVDSVTGSGTIRLDVADDDSIESLSTIPLGGTGNGNGSFITGQAYTTPIGTPPAITSLSSATFIVGAPGSFTVTATGTSAPGLSETGALPGGVSFIDNGNGTATLAGTPGIAGTFPISLTAANGITPNASQSFVLTVDAGAQATVTVTAPASATYGQTGLSAIASGGSGTGAYSYSAGTSTAC